METPLHTLPTAVDFCHIARQFRLALESHVASAIVEGPAPQLPAEHQFNQLDGALLNRLIDFLRSIETAEFRTSEGSKATLTTQDVAEILGCSRPHVVKLLEQGTIPFSKVGSHRRVCMEDVAAYKRSTRERQRQALIQLMQTDEEHGLYGK
jgi:excisionase family DNA binding protein